KAPPKYDGHRAKAMTHIHHAIKVLEAPANSGSSNPNSKGNNRGKGKGGSGGNGGAAQGGNQMKLAVQQMDQAINELKAGIKYYQAEGGKGGKDKNAGGLAKVLPLVTKAKQMAQKKK